MTLVPPEKGDLASRPRTRGPMSQVISRGWEWSQVEGWEWSGLRWRGAIASGGELSPSQVEGSYHWWMGAIAGGGKRKIAIRADGREIGDDLAYDRAELRST